MEYPETEPPGNSFIMKTPGNAFAWLLTTIHVIVITTLSVLMSLPADAVAQQKRPNIVMIIADDLGYGDLSCYGQRLFKTPNIDKLASEGIKFTNHYSGSPVCAPSRSALMTGLHTGHTYVRGNKEVEPEGQWPLPDEAYTLTEMLKSAGYTTGVFGKWGLGYPGSEGAPEKQGVDKFFGYNCQRLAHNYYPAHLWDNTTKIYLEGNRGELKSEYAPELIHQAALKFLDQNRDTTFFLFYPLIMPHAELVAPEKYMALYRGKFQPEKSFEGVDAGEKDFRNGGYSSQPEAHAAFAAMMHVLDEQVGSIMEKLKALDLDENTVVIFSSDNGPHIEAGADPDYFDSNGILRGYKRDLYEGGIRVPFIARWPDVIEAGTVSAHVSAFWDIMPTLADLLQIKIKQKTDGISFLPTLTGKQKQQEQHEFLYWEFHELGSRRAVRQDDWKLIQYNVGKNPPGSLELYNLKADPREQNDLATDQPEVVARMKKILMREHIPSAAFRFANENK